MKTEQITSLVQDYIRSLSYARQPMGLYDPIEYVLGVGGKRLRPVLMALAYNIYKVDVEAILSQAAAIETYHNFTLLHDDLMDKADMRRGRPTVHKKWDDNTAILSGDAMLILSFKLMMRGCPQHLASKVMDVFSQAALEVCEGQQWDMEFETRDDVTEEDYMEMIRLKTGVLIASPMKIGAILGGASEEDAEKLYQFGIKMGLAFQLQDDYLDVYGDPATFGKKIGGDILCNKKTFMLISALNLAGGGDKAKLIDWLKVEIFDAEEKIAGVTHIYNKVGIADICKRKIDELYYEGLALLDSVSADDERKTQLREYVCGLIDRKL